jgi:hypothetical protein
MRNSFSVAAIAATLLTQTLAAGPLAYVATIGADGKGSFGIADLSRGVIHKLSALPNPVGALGFANGFFYSIDNYNVLVRIDAATGKATEVGPTNTSVPPSLPPGAGSNPIAVLSDGRIYSIDLYGMLYLVDPKTGAGKVLGTTGIPVPDYTDPQFVFSNGFTAIGNELYYLWGGADSKHTIHMHLYRIDPDTSIAYDIGPAGTDAITALGTAQGRLFSQFLDPQTFAPVAVAEVDRVTGKATVYAPMSSDQDLIFAISDTPEPVPGAALPSVPTAAGVPAFRKVHRNNQ